MEGSVVTEEIPHHRPENLFGYTKLQLAKRSKQLKEMERDYPSLPYGWLEMVWDYCETRTTDEVEKVINSGEFEGPSFFSQNAAKLSVAEANEKNKIVL